MVDQSTFSTSRRAAARRLLRRSSHLRHVGAHLRGRLGFPAWVLLTLGLASTSPIADASSHAALDCAETAEIELMMESGKPRRSHFLGIEDLFQGLIRAWPERGGEETAAGLSDLEQRLAERLECLGGVTVEFPDSLPGAEPDRPAARFLGTGSSQEGTAPPFVCLAAVEGATFEPVFARRPEALLAVARLYQHKHAHQLAQRRLAHAERSLAQAQALLDAYLAESGEAADHHTAATLLVMAGVELAGLRSLRASDQAISLLHRALEMAPHHRLALYLAAHLDEKLADYPHARDHLIRLDEELPGDPEFRLRLAINHGRTGRPRLAVAGLRGLLDAQPDWIAVVAAQELARQLANREGNTAAAEVLESALRRFPDSSQLRLQLAQTLHADWRESWPLVDRVLNGWQGDPGEPARVAYERGRPGWVREVAAELNRRLQPVRESIGLEVAELALRNDRRRLLDTYPWHSLCHGTLPLRRLPQDPGPGPFAPGSPGYDG